MARENPTASTRHRPARVGDQSSDGGKIRGEPAGDEITSLCCGEGARRMPEPFFEVDRRVLGRAARRRVRGGQRAQITARRILGPSRHGRAKGGAVRAEFLPKVDQAIESVL